MHRFIPLLGDYRVIKPGWTLPVTLFCSVVRFVSTIFDLITWTVVSDLLLAGWHNVRWGLAGSLRAPLFGRLHISFAWLFVAMILYALDSLLQIAGSPTALGHAPLHALGIGFVTGMVVSMASRVSMGHSGRPLVADRIAFWTFALVQISAVVRVIAESDWVFE